MDQIHIKALDAFRKRFLKRVFEYPICFFWVLTGFFHKVDGTIFIILLNQILDEIVINHVSNGKYYLAYVFIPNNSPLLMSIPALWIFSNRLSLGK